MPKKRKKKEKKVGTNFDLTTDSVIEKYQAILTKFKIRISQIIAKILPKQQSLKPNQTLFYRMYLYLTSFSLIKTY